MSPAPMSDPLDLPALPQFLNLAGQASVVFGAGGVVWWLLRVHTASTVTYEQLKAGLQGEVERLSAAGESHAGELREIAEENRRLRAEVRALRAERDMAEREIARLERLVPPPEP